MAAGTRSTNGSSLGRRNPLRKPPKTDCLRINKSRGSLRSAWATRTERLSGNRPFSVRRPSEAVVCRQFPSPDGLGGPSYTRFRTASEPYRLGWFAFGRRKERLVQLQRRGVDAVAQTGGRRTIGKNVAEMPFTPAAEDLHSPHGVAVVGSGLQGGRIVGLPIARPTGSRFEFRIGAKQGLAATRTAVHAGSLRLPVFPRERPLGTLAPQNVVLLARQAFLPFRVRLGKRLAASLANSCRRTDVPCSPRHRSHRLSRTAPAKGTEPRTATAKRKAREILTKYPPSPFFNAWMCLRHIISAKSGR